MAATNYTPIQLYYSTTASAAPTAGNLTNGELAINITDGKLYYKDNGGVVQVIATKGAGTIGGSNTQIQYNNSGALAGSSAMTFNSGTNTVTLTTLNLTNALGATYGGTAQSSYTQGDILYSSATNTLSKLGIGTVNYILTSTGSVPQWVAPTSVTVQTANNLAGGAAGSVPYQSGASTTTFLSIGTAGQVLTSSGSAPQWSNLSSLGVTSLSFGTTGLTPSTATQGAITVAGTLATTNGGTGLTSFTANRVFYASSTSAIGQSANLTFDGTTLTAANFTDSSLTSGRVTYATTGGNLTDSANLLYSGTDLTVYGITVGRGAGAVSTNTAVGASALAANTSGEGEVALGNFALGSNTTGNYNTAVGAGGTLYFNTTGSNNAAFGHNALRNNTTASNNTAVGYQAGYSNTTGARNLSAGVLSLYANTTGVSNTALGSGEVGVIVGALGSNTTGSYNTAVGDGALRANTTASFNTAVGYQAGYSNTTGSPVTAFGYLAAYSTQTAVNITAIGAYALQNSTGGFNSAVGHAALNGNTSGANNTAFGSDALRSNTTASNNTAVGYQALYANTTAADMVALGYRAAYGYADASLGSVVAIGSGALSSATTSFATTAVGAGAGRSITTGDRNTLIGQGAGSGITTGQSNTIIGPRTTGGSEPGSAITTGSKNTILGAYTGNQGGLDIRTANNYIVLSDGDGNPRLMANGNGQWAMGMNPRTDWPSNWSVLNIQGNNNLWGVQGQFQLGYNNYYDGTNYRYGASGYAHRTIMTDSGHYWDSAPSGSTGGAITFETQMQIDLQKSLALRGATPQAGTGITFPASQFASSNANTLDDYEEGTWTPTSTTPNISISVIGTARYTKIGRQVSTYFYATITNSTGANINGINVSGLPFASLGYAPAFTYYSPSLSRDIYGGYTESAQAYINSGVTIVPGGNSVMLAAFYFVD